MFTGNDSPHLSPTEIWVRQEYIIYNTQRVLRQFSYDQGSLRVRDDTSFTDALVAKTHFVKEGRAEIPPNLRGYSTQV